MKIIDTHVHVFPDNLAEKVRSFLEAYYKVPFRGKGTRDDILTSMREGRIHISLVFSTATKAAQVQTINDYIAGLVRDNPEFIGFGTIHPDFPNVTNEIKRIQELGLRGIKLHPDFQQLFLDEKRMMKIYGAIEGKLPVLCHVGDQNSDFSSPRRLGKIADTFPGLTIIAAHFGGYSQWNDAERYVIGKRNVYIDTSSSLPWMPQEQALRIIHNHGADRVLFASDYPIVYQKDAVQDFLNLPLNEDEKEMIFHRNAENLLSV